MFRWISIISFAAVFAGIFLHNLIFRRGEVSHKKETFLAAVISKQKKSWLGWLRGLIFLLGLLSFLVLLLTGFAPVVLGTKLQGYLLMIHATFSPVFIGCVAILALLGAGQYRFNKEDGLVIPFGCQRSQIKGCWLTDSGLGAKIGFWLLLVTALPVTLTMAVSMLPWFGTKGQEYLYITHRWSALAFGVIAVMELYMLIRMENREEL